MSIDFEFYLFIFLILFCFALVLFADVEIATRVKSIMKISINPILVDMPLNQSIFNADDR